MARSSSDHGDDDRQPGWGIERRQQPPAADLGHQRHANGRRGKDEAHEQRVDDDHAEIARPPAKPADGLPSPRSHEFPQRHRREDGGKGPQTDPGLVGEQDVCQDQLFGRRALTPVISSFN